MLNYSAVSPQLDSDLSGGPAVDFRGEVAIAAHSLLRTFKGGIEALRDIDLTVCAGEVFGFLGPNGAGKTTTVRMLCTLLPPSAGHAIVAGLDVVKQSAEVRRRIGVALQEIGLDPVRDRGGAGGPARTRAGPGRAGRACPVHAGFGILSRCGERDTASGRPGPRARSDP